MYVVCRKYGFHLNHPNKYIYIIIYTYVCIYIYRSVCQTHHTHSEKSYIHVSNPEGILYQLQNQLP
jgi:hypothetical protein